MQFFRYLYHNVPDLLSLWMSPEFLCALAATVFPFNIRPYSEMVGNPVSCFVFPLNVIFEGLINSHTKIQLYLPCRNNSSKGWTVIVLRFWNWGNCMFNWRAVAMQWHLKLNFRGMYALYLFAAGPAFSLIWTTLAQIYKSNRDWVSWCFQLSALEDVIKSSHFPISSFVA